MFKKSIKFLFSTGFLPQRGLYKRHTLQAMLLSNIDNTTQLLVYMTDWSEAYTQHITSICQSDEYVFLY